MIINQEHNALYRRILDGKIARVLFNYVAMNTDGLEVELHHSWTSALDGDEWSASRPCRFIPEERRQYPFDKRLDGSQSRSDRFGEEKNFAPDRNRSPAFQLSYQGSVIIMVQLIIHIWRW
jgi:hypothetical protein